MIRRIAILGGGPAGSFAAAQLASAGLAVQLFDEKLAWEKPCGGGLTFKAYHQYPFLLHNAIPKRLVTQTTLGAPGAGQAGLKLHDPLVIYSRLDLNRMLLDRAERAGAQLEKTRVLGLSRSGSRWRLRTSAGTAEADYCILATGARNSLRDFGTQLHPRDTMAALGYYVDGEQDNVDIQFLDELEGYIWVFPRCGHLSVGICGKGVPAFELRKRLDLYMKERGLSAAGARFYSHLLPCLDKASWRHNRVAGDGWIAVGDAAGLVDPITGEGIYYAIRSGDLAAQAVLAESPAAGYSRLLRRDFASDLEFGSRLAKRVFLGRFLCAPLPRRMVEFTRHSPRFAAIMQDLFAGRQPYTGLKRRLLSNLNGSLYEIGMSLGFSRVVPWRLSQPRP
jgi:geranylgeranyl reductase family protein